MNRYAKVEQKVEVVYSQSEIAELAFSILGKLPKITRIPTWLARATIGAMRLFNRHAADLFDFFATAGQHENVAPRFGTHVLDDYFRQLRRSTHSEVVKEVQAVDRLGAASGRTDHK